MASAPQINKSETVVEDEPKLPGTEIVSLPAYDQLGKEGKDEQQKLFNFHVSLLELTYGLGTTEARVAAYYEGLPGLGKRGYGPFKP